MQGNEKFHRVKIAPSSGWKCSAFSVNNPESNDSKPIGAKTLIPRAIEPFTNGNRDFLSDSDFSLLHDF
ncbi:MAG: hypothetical protein D6680_02605 [Cyanobacteria bacterium J007]|nr:MAG: hypothetical protein D6680_02605 [Cyanobacteria bacterium J007]